MGNLQEKEIAMRKVPLIAVFWTLLLAVPLTTLALSGLAYTTEHLTEILNAIVGFGKATTVGGRGLLQEIAQRWPEVAGMFVGQAVLMTILIFAHQAQKSEGPAGVPNR
jgi:hypothetical protein